MPPYSIGWKQVQQENSYKRTRTFHGIILICAGLYFLLLLAS